jgi:hypothetical protein
MVGGQSYPTLELWLAALDAAAQAAVARAGFAQPEAHRTQAGACKEHGPSCAWVTYGAIRHHVAWAEESPEQFVARIFPGKAP